MDRETLDTYIGIVDSANYDPHVVAKVLEHLVREVDSLYNRLEVHSMATAENLEQIRKRVAELEAEWISALL